MRLTEAQRKYFPFLCGLDALIIDRVLKWLALSQPLSPPEGWISFSLFRNPGIAFSIPVPDAVFWPLAAAIFSGLLWYFIQELRTRPVVAFGAWLILLGAASNIFDRIAYDATIDYLLLFERSAVNIADGMIIAGIITALIAAKKPPSAAPQPAAAQ